MDSTCNNAPAATERSSSSPTELLGKLAGWMSAAGYGSDHPWRISIDETLAVHGHAPGAAPELGERTIEPARVHAAVEAACQISQLMALLDTDPSAADYAVHIRVEQLADAIVGAIGGETFESPLDDVQHVVFGTGAHLRQVRAREQKA